MSLSTKILLLGAVSAALYLAQTWFNRFITSRRHGCEPPPKRRVGDPIFGLAARIRDASTSRSCQSLPAGVALHAEFGSTFRETTIIGGTHLRTTESDNIHTVFSTRAADWGVEAVRLRAMGPFMGAGFLTKDGPVWEHSRAMLKPSFRKHNISDLSPFDHILSQTLERIPKDGSTIDLQPLLLLMFVDTSTLFLLGKSAGVLDGSLSASAPVQGVEFVKAFQLSLRSCGMRIAMGTLSVFLPKSATSQQWKIVHRLVDHYINLARDSKTSQTKGSQSLLDSVTQQTDDLLEIRHQIIQGMTAAQDTTPLLISNTIFLLSRNPDIYTRLRAEVSNLGPETPSFEDMRQCRLLRHVLQESLRLYPIFPILGRVALKDTILPCGGGSEQKSPIYVHAGTRLIADFYALHRDQSVYGPEVEKFIPDRWNTIKPGPWQYLAFGGGTRACLGKEKALAEASCTLIRIAQMFREIRSRDEKDWTGDQKLVARNVNGCKVAFVLA